MSENISKTELDKLWEKNYFCKLNENVRDPEVQRHIAFVLTKAFSNVDRVFADIVGLWADEMRDPFPFRDRTECVHLIEQDQDIEQCIGKNKQTWSQFAEFYKKIGYYRITDLFSKGRIVVNRINFKSHKCMGKLYKEFKSPEAETPVALGAVIFPNSDADISDSIPAINKGLARVLFWPTEVLMAFCFNVSGEAVNKVEATAT